MAKHTEIGTKGELLALIFLKNKGYEILHTNWKSGRKEIDIIAATSEFIVFVEVKTRSSFSFGYPEEAVNSGKKEAIKMAAEAYFEQYAPGKLIRFDIISVLVKDGSAQEIVHLEDAFY